MKSKTLILTFMVMLLALVAGNHLLHVLTARPNLLNHVKKWFVLLDYSAQTQFSIDKANQYQMAIFDPDSHPSLAELSDPLILIAYLSVGEAEDYRAYWDEHGEASWILSENPNWAGNYLVDVRRKEWKTLILDVMLPEIIGQGFQGLMLDTLDTAEVLEESDPEKYRGMYRAMSELVGAIHRQYPDLMLISNNGFSILRDIAPYLSGMLVEDIHGMVDFEAQQYLEVGQEERNKKVVLLKSLMRQFDLPVFNIDYLDRQDTQRARRYERQSRELGFVPYLAEKNLSEIYQM